VQVCALARMAEEVCSQELQYKGCAAAAPPHRLHYSACALVDGLLRRVAREQPLLGRQARMVSACEGGTPTRARCSRPGVHSKGGGCCCLAPGSAPGAEAWRRAPERTGAQHSLPPYLAYP
jgi:hypothetical protein